MTDKAIRAHFIAGGQYHDIDYARRTILDLLSEHEDLRVSVAPDYSSLHCLADSAFLVTYTCNVLPKTSEVAALKRFLEGGGRWLALHGTNSILAQNEKGRWYAPEDDTGFVELLGSQFAAHPPIAPYEVKRSDQDDPLLKGVSNFVVEGGDELYYMRLFGEIDVLLEAQAQGPAKGFVERDWPEGEAHPVLYRKRVGKGEILYFTLGHRRGHYDMAPLIDYYPHQELGAWEIDPYIEILKRGLSWAKGAPSLQV
ncbi:ThuA domain-containing protein [Hyphococcus sp.]|uniref:ThuA domain-containing protein n=1 Tax=Hyphococcus sp. TaxID=2038636 RepID=UPI003CCB9339